MHILYNTGTHPTAAPEVGALIYGMHLLTINYHNHHWLPSKPCG